MHMVSELCMYHPVLLVFCPTCCFASQPVVGIIYVCLCTSCHSYVDTGRYQSLEEVLSFTNALLSFLTAHAVDTKQTLLGLAVLLVHEICVGLFPWLVESSE